MLTGSLSPGTSERDAGSVMSLSRFQILIHSSLDTCSTFLSPSFSCSCTAVKNRIADKLPGKSRQKLCMIFFKLTLRWFSKFVPVMCDGSRRVFKLAFIITAKKKKNYFPALVWSILKVTSQTTPWTFFHFLMFKPYVPFRNMTSKGSEGKVIGTSKYVARRCTSLTI